MLKGSSLEGTTTIKPNGSKNTQPFPLIRASKFNCRVSVQCFQCLPCISLCSKQFHNKENMNELVYMVKVKVEWQEYSCLNPPSHDCRRASRRKLLFSVIPLSVVQLCSDWNTDVWKSMVYFVGLSIKCHSWDTPSWRICGLGVFF